jgi:uncharacterized protein
MGTEARATFRPWGAGLVAAGLLGCAAAASQTPSPQTEAALSPAASASAPAARQVAAGLPFRLPCGDQDLIGCTYGCNDHITEDCVTLASMYLAGTVVSMDRDRAIGLLREACDKDSARGCLRLGDLYHQGILKGEAEETTFYRRACEAGANLGCVTAGRAFLSGRGVNTDPASAAQLFARVCDRGNAQACFELARLYKQGEGVKQDSARATDLFTKACKLGFDEACLRAGGDGEVLPPRN